MEDIAKDDEKKALKALNTAAKEDKKSDEKSSEEKKEAVKSEPKTQKAAGTNKSSPKKTSKNPKTTGSKRGTAQKKSDEKNREITAEIVSIGIIGLSILTIIGVYLGGGGIIGQGLGAALKGFFGFGAYVLPLILIGFCIYMFFAEIKVLNAPKTIMIFSMFFLVISFLHIIHIDSDNVIKYDGFGLFSKAMYKSGGYFNGGLFGAYLGTVLYKAMGKAASIILIILAFISLGVFITGKSFFSGLKNTWKKISSYFVFEIENDDYIEDEEQYFEEEVLPKKKINILSFFKNKKNAEDKNIVAESPKEDIRVQVKKQRQLERQKQAEAKKEEETKIYIEIPKPTVIDIKPKNAKKEHRRLELAYDTVMAARENIEPAKIKRIETDLPDFIKNRERFEYEKFLEKGQSMPKINGVGYNNDQQEMQYHNTTQETELVSSAYSTAPMNYNGETQAQEPIYQEPVHQEQVYKEPAYEEPVLDIRYLGNENIENKYNEFYPNEEISEEINYQSKTTSDFEASYSSVDENDVPPWEESSKEVQEEFELYQPVNSMISRDSFETNMISEPQHTKLMQTGDFEVNIINEPKPMKTGSFEVNQINKPQNTKSMQINNFETNTMNEPQPVIVKAEKSKTVNELNIDKEAKKAEYVFPKLEFLGKNPMLGESRSSEIELLENSKILVRTLASFNVEATVVEISKGPAVTRYELSIVDGIKVSKILGLADNLALSLAATSIRIEAPIPGKSAVGIEIPNREVTSVYLSEVVCDERFQKFPSKLSFGLGKDIAGNVVVTDIAKMPHMLIAGATGSGKSVCINTLITSILYKSTPDEVRLIMVDPKVVELSVYNGIPHLLIPVVTEPDKASGALNWAVHEMMERYNKFAETSTRNLKGYNEILAENGEKKLPQIVIIIDELADLMMVAAKEVEAAICRLAQLARAAGIHLIIATQRPSVDVITGLIKANIPSRIAFAVSSGTDSRTIIDTVGAEKLLGKGDMLFKSVDMSKPLRVQGAFVTDKEVENIVSFLKENNPAVYDEEVINKIANMGDSDNSSGGGGDFGSDELTDEVISFIVISGKCSTSLIQRKFRLGYNRAARIVEELEDRGIIGPENGSKPREVLMDKYQMEEYFTRNAGY